MTSALPSVLGRHRRQQRDLHHPPLPRPGHLLDRVELQDHLDRRPLPHRPMKSEPRNYY